MIRAVASRAPAVARVEAAAYIVPTDFPESDGTFQWDRTTMVVAEVSAGDSRGLGYTYATSSVTRLIDDVLAESISGRDPMDVP